MYSPKINDKFIPMLYRIAKEKKVPMTRVVNQVVREYLANYITEKQLRK